MGVLSRVRSLFRQHPAERPDKNVDARAAQPPRKRDYHKKVRMTIRLDAHVRDGARTYAKESGTSVSELCNLFLSGLMWSKQAPRLRKLVTGRAIRAE